MTSYEYKATVLAVHDGDTLHLDVDLGQRMMPRKAIPVDLGFSTYVEVSPWTMSPGLFLHEDFRLFGINAPELANPDGSGIAARDYLIGLLTDPTTGRWKEPIWIRTVRQPTSTENPEKQEKYGRWLATLWTDTAPGLSLSVNDLMISSGHAVPFMT